MTTTPQTPFQIWYQAIRPRSLTATYIPIALGAVIAWDADAFHLVYFVLALLGTLALQIAANLFNEYFDYRKGVESGKSHGLGLILKNGYLTPDQVLWGAIVNIVAGSLIGLFFVAQTGPVILWIGVGAVAVVILYTAGPFPLAYIGLGEIAVFVFMGPLIVFGTYFVMTEEFDSLPLVAALPIGFIVAAIMHANNQRDLEADTQGGKYTLSVRFGRRFAQGFYLFLVGGTYASLLIIVLFGVAPFVALIGFVTAPEALRLCRIVISTEDVPQLHGVLVHTARLHAWFGMAYIVGWFLGVLL